MEKISRKGFLKIAAAAAMSGVTAAGLAACNRFTRRDRGIGTLQGLGSGGAGTQYQRAGSQGEDADLGVHGESPGFRGGADAGR